MYYYQPIQRLWHSRRTGKWKCLFGDHKLWHFIWTHRDTQEPRVVYFLPCNQISRQWKNQKDVYNPEIPMGYVLRMAELNERATTPRRSRNEKIVRNQDIL